MWGQVRRRPCFGEVSVWEIEKVEGTYELRRVRRREGTDRAP